MGQGARPTKGPAGLKVGVHVTQGRELAYELGGAGRNPAGGMSPTPQR